MWLSGKFHLCLRVKAAASFFACRTRSEVGKGARNSNGTNASEQAGWCLPRLLGSASFLPLGSGVAFLVLVPLHTVVAIFDKAEPRTACDSNLERWARQKAGKNQECPLNFLPMLLGKPKGVGRVPSSPLSRQVLRILPASSILPGSVWESRQGVHLMSPHNRNRQTSRPACLSGH